MKKYSYALLITLFAFTGASFAAPADNPIKIHVNHLEYISGDQNSTSMWNDQLEQMIKPILLSDDDFTVKASELNKLGIKYGPMSASAHCKVNGGNTATIYNLDVINGGPILECHLTAVK